MSGQEWLCLSCSRCQASSFCFCGGLEVFLCKDCWPQHYSKNSHLLHIAVPISAYGQHRIPGYFERLQSRSVQFGSVKVELMKNLEVVERCIAELSAEVQRVIDAISDYGERQICQLQQLKTELSAEIEKALEETSKSLHDDSPFLSHPLAVNIREFSGDPNSLKLFNYRIDPTAIINSTQSLCTITRSTSSISDRIIAGIYENKMQVYDFVADSSQELTLASRYTSGISTCVLPTGALLCIGGNPVSMQTSIIHFRTGKIQELSPMTRPRAHPGLACVGYFAYVFGSLKTDNTCEVFDLKLKEWKKLPDMYHARHTFSPSHLNGAIYLVTTKQPIEVYDIASSSFNLLNVIWTGGESACSSIFVDGELHLFTSHDVMGRWKPGDDAIEKVECQSNEIGAFSQCQPARYKRKVFFIYWKTGLVNVFDLDTKVRTRKV